MQFCEIIQRRNKRSAQQLLTEALLDTKPRTYIPGDVYVLAGPDPLGAIKQFDNLNLGNPVFVEQDKQVYEIAKRRLGEAGGGYPIFNADLFEVLKRPDNSCVSGIDIDLCGTLHLEVREAIAEALQAVMLDNKLPCFWVRITSSPRRVGTVGVYRAIEDIKEWAIEEELDYRTLGEKYCSYPGEVGGAMQSWQGYFIHLKEKGKAMLRPKTVQMRMKRRGEFVPLRELDPKTRELLNMVIEDGYMPTPEIVQQFHVSPTTVAALLAHATRRRTKTKKRKK